ncbi:hypothetical protein [Bradyrhizobium rifense]|nr:hypothetical protein [Bradyrhizobium rifense]
MRDVLTFDSGLRWVLVETAEDARLATGLLGMRLCTSYAVDEALGYGSNYYVLTNRGMDVGHVMVRDGDKKVMHSASDGKLVWGHDFSDPWPQFDGEIAALSGHIGVELGRRHCPHLAKRYVGPGI